jgi:DNA-binding NarL/FixJ family response regulator
LRTEAEEAYGGAMTIRVALVDDHRLFREGLRALLGTQPDLCVVAEASDAREVPTTVESSQPDVVVLDYQLKGVAGPSIVRDLLERNRNRRILLLSMHLEEDRIAQALAAGALGYANKEQGATELFGAIRTVANGRPYLAPALSHFVFDDYVRIQRDGKSNSTPLAPLTGREKEVFELVIRGMANDTIAQTLAISRRTVETHRSRILHKLHAHSVADLMRFAARHGLLDA